MSIKVGVLGAKGRMGSEVVKAVSAAPDLELAATVDLGDSLDSVSYTHLTLPTTSRV